MTSISISVCGQALLHGALDVVSPVAAGVGDVLRTSDASLANLEATVAAVGAWPTKTKTLHLTDIWGIASCGLSDSDVLTHANNHAFHLDRQVSPRPEQLSSALGCASQEAALIEPLRRGPRKSRHHAERWQFSRPISDPSRQSCMRPTIAAASTPFACNAKRLCRHQLTTCCASLLKALATIGERRPAPRSDTGASRSIPRGSRCSEQRS